MKEKIKGIIDYFNAYKELEKEIDSRKLDKKIKIAILSSFTVKGIKEVLSIKCYNLNILPAFYIGNYNQYAQEILNLQSVFYKFNPDLIIFFVDTKALWGDIFFLPYQLSNEERKKSIDEKFNELCALIKQIKENSSAKILLHNFEVPSYSPLGILENKEKFGFFESIENLNAKLREVFKEDSQVFVFDYNSFCSKIGKKNITDYKLYYLGDMKLDLNLLPDLCEEYLSYIKPIMSISKKCIVLDLDNTLWGGIIGEDGIEGIKLSPTSEGRSFMEFQKHLLSLFNRGIILAINSKNNLDDALKVFREHPHSVLKEENFAALQINWNDKISNMKAIAEEINIGTDSLVYIDDDKFNREIIKKAFPEILVVELPEDPSLYSKTLMELNEFNILAITDEDKKRGKIYAEQRKRQEFQKSATDITEYLKALQMNVTIERANSFNIPRISQLTQKTNQFNMTTNRYSEEDIKTFSENNKFLVVSVKVEDKFGDNGVTGIAIVEKGKEKWKINSFLLSCRVIGRRVEETLLAYIAEQAKKEKAQVLVGEFIHTSKNAVAKDFYKTNNFQLKNKDKDKEIWEYSLEKDYKFPDFIKVIKK